MTSHIFEKSYFINDRNYIVKPIILPLKSNEVLNFETPL